MRCFLWNGIPTYDYFVECNRREMWKLVRHYHIDPRFFYEGSAKTWEIDGEEKFYYFISAKRKRIALLPFLSIAFGGMYDELPVGDPISLRIKLREYKLEDFQFK